MIMVPPGTFTMGADTGGEADERPAHKVALPGYWLDRTEVTNEAYDACVAAKACRAPLMRAFRSPKQPVTFVSWDDAQTFCKWKGKRLPREAEFERAIRGDDARRFPWGNEEPSATRAVFGVGQPKDVGSLPAGKGPFGHDDLAGNVWEWMEDFYDPIAYTREKVASCDEIMATQKKLAQEGKHGFTGTNPIPNECEHSIRGGAYNYGGAGLRATNRVHHAGYFRIAVLGFRCARDL
jgi:formylglycine-generating enzyme required for sulfatase activity